MMHFRQYLGRGARLASEYGSIIVLWNYTDTKRAEDSLLSLVTEKEECRQAMLYREFGEVFESTGKCCDNCVAQTEGSAKPALALPTPAPAVKSARPTLPTTAHHTAVFDALLASDLSATASGFVRALSREFSDAFGEGCDMSACHYEVECHRGIVLAIIADVVS